MTDSSVGTVIFRIALRISVDVDPPPTDEEIRDISRILKRERWPEFKQEQGVIKSNYTVDKADVWYTSSTAPWPEDRGRPAETFPDDLKSQESLKHQDVDQVFLITFPDAEFLVEKDFSNYGYEVTGRVHEVDGSSSTVRGSGTDYLEDFGDGYDIEGSKMMDNGSVTTNADMLKRITEIGLSGELGQAGSWLRGLPT
jgi:hypothetical protein